MSADAFCKTRGTPLQGREQSLARLCPGFCKSPAGGAR